MIYYCEVSQLRHFVAVFISYLFDYFSLFTDICPFCFCFGIIYSDMDSFADCTETYICDIFPKSLGVVYASQFPFLSLPHLMSKELISVGMKIHASGRYTLLPGISKSLSIAKPSM